MRKKYYQLTKKQLKIWGLKYHKLVMFKTSYDLFVDDKVYGSQKNWYQDFNKYL